ncbi:MAG: uroporphyrin-III C-methyltransferase / precorrin-2 dehydrogenase / sirohydrochlorin ferrochelatase C [Rhodobacteraceae bacterium HLUCCA12]|nr:MAG: uroporphyrin-III C-methyltransferase / precorrin-2 dehydrogenase / sirohydrochlorin ferrochelatase C [Rhodobacteraceae bacterium HLUCCA12]
MQHFPIFLDLSGARVVVSGGGEAALAKLRLLMKTEARLDVFAAVPSPEVAALADAGRITLHERAPVAGDMPGARLVYGAAEDAQEDARVAALARDAGVLVNIVDNLHDSDYITPAIVDRDPVVVAIGTEGAAPVLARSIKAGLEARLPVALGLLARAGKAFRAAADALPMGRRRRDFWAEYYDTVGPRAAERGEAALEPALQALLDRHLAQTPKAGRVDLVGAGPGDPELLTLKARRLLDQADVVVHDRLVPNAILELARREALLIAVGKEGFGPSTPQSRINDLIVEHAARGAHVVRLKGGDPAVFGRLDDEVEALDAAGIDWAVVPGITAASASAAALGQSLTRRGRNASARLVTGHDVQGYAEQDWQALARPGAVAAVYMGKRAARFIQGRMLMHGAAPETPVSVVENATRPDQRILPATLASMPQVVADLAGPAVLLLGLAPRRAVAAEPLEIAL